MSSTSRPPRLERRDGVYLNYIDGAWGPAASGGVYDNVDPSAPSTVHGRVPESSAEEVRRAVEAAARDFDAWRLGDGDFRSKVFFRLTDLLKASERVLVETMTRMLHAHATFEGEGLGHNADRERADFARHFGHDRCRAGRTNRGSNGATQRTPPEAVDHPGR